MSAAVVTGRVSTKGTRGRLVGPVTRVTWAPRSMASRAMAYPIRPELWLVRKRTGSRASWVGPAVTVTRTPWRVLGRASSRAM